MFFEWLLKGIGRILGWESTRVERVFVLVLENRSFDHMLGFADLSGQDAATGLPTKANGLAANSYWNYRDPRKPRPEEKIFATEGADAKLGKKEIDPGHEFHHTLEQLCGPDTKYPDPLTGSYPQSIDCSGYISSYLREGGHSVETALKAFSPSQVPVLKTLAEEFAVCDQWFCSLPGPTWPNRFFLHAGTSGGLDHSPTKAELAYGHIWGWHLQHGTMFDWLSNIENAIEWRVYEGDSLPQCYEFEGMGRYKDRFYPFDDFVADLHSTDKPFTPKYVFIEPDYGRYIRPPGDYSGGTSQHPKDDIRSGERLIKQVYEAIRQSRYWKTSLLVVTYDEHGGFYDHVRPESATPPGDKEAPGNNISGFDFSRYGVRVPTIIVSPWTPKKTIDHRVYDHTSILRTLMEVFPRLKQDGFKTQRIANAKPFLDLLTLAKPRIEDSEAPLSLPSPEEPADVVGEDGEGRDRPEDLLPFEDRPISPEVAGFLHVAFLRARSLQEYSVAEQDMKVEEFRAIRTLGEAAQYIDQVKEAVAEHYRVRRGIYLQE